MTSVEACGPTRQEKDTRPAALASSLNPESPPELTGTETAADDGPVVDAHLYLTNVHAPVEADRER
jgi:hypothetical protein